MGIKHRRNTEYKDLTIETVESRLLGEMWVLHLLPVTLLNSAWYNSPLIQPSGGFVGDILYWTLIVCAISRFEI